MRNGRFERSEAISKSSSKCLVRGELEWRWKKHHVSFGSALGGVFLLALETPCYPLSSWARGGCSLGYACVPEFTWPWAGKGTLFRKWKPRLSSSASRELTARGGGVRLLGSKSAPATHQLSQGKSLGPSAAVAGETGAGDRMLMGLVSGCCCCSKHYHELGGLDQRRCTRLRSPKSDVPDQSSRFGRQRGPRWSF